MVYKEKVDNSSTYYEILDLLGKLNEEHELHDVIINCEDICAIKYDHYLPGDPNWRRKRLVVPSR